MHISTAAIALALSPFATAIEGSNARNLRANVNKTKTKIKNNRPQSKACLLLLKETRFLDGTNLEEVDCFDSSNGLIAKIKGPNGAQEDFIRRFKNGELKSGKSTLKKNGAYFDEDGNLVLPNLDNLEIGESSENTDKRRLATVVGDKEMLAIRVVAPDASTTSSESEISDSWFGTSGDPVNLKSQYAACSYGQLRCEGASKTTSTGVTVSDGVYTVELSNTVSGVHRDIVRDWVLTEGDAILGSIKSQFDHVMLCLPPGTRGDWIAYAYINWYLSIYNDEWCNYVSGQMHEIGHNLNLAHSGEGSEEYGDRTGMMGYSYSSDDAPLMCFNAPKNWQLGWYSDGQKVVTTGWSGKIYGIADYGGIDHNGSAILVQIPASVYGGTDDWYVSFNRQTGINAGTQEGGDQVLLHKRPAGTGFAESTLVTKLSAGTLYISAPLLIEVHSIHTSSNPGYAAVTIGDVIATPFPSDVPVTPSPTVAPVTNTPTTAPVTDSPTAAPVTDAPTAAPVTDAPTDSPSKAPVTDAPITAAPVTGSPITDAPTASPTTNPTSAPITPAPVTPAPVSIAPTGSPVTSSPTNVPTRSPTSSPVEICSIDKCYACVEGGACRKEGCLWVRGVCQDLQVCAPDNCSACYNGGECKKNGCSWKKGVCS
eukprot:CAMPEP_0196803776 /NCGR_PEP_ID=MMETSP1362-20130617/3256_1 /TAXON_ID=163516 /ORGANISM="Leptocylindrus danicus, Strain CCMP1856" /LENGTH=651 /DNA_ID=CAMNT_0042175603 /DNA_START=64 /DNA_END=2019 /DNA_ORIENTATION=+